MEKYKEFKDMKKRIMSIKDIFQMTVFCILGKV